MWWVAGLCRGLGLGGVCMLGQGSWTLAVGDLSVSSGTGWMVAGEALLLVILVGSALSVAGSVSPCQSSGGASFGVSRPRPD